MTRSERSARSEHGLRPAIEITEYGAALATLAADPRLAPGDKPARRAYETATLAKLQASSAR